MFNSCLQSFKSHLQMFSNLSRLYDPPFNLDLDVNMTEKRERKSGVTSYEFQAAS